MSDTSEYAAALSFYTDYLPVSPARIGTATLLKSGVQVSVSGGHSGQLDYLTAFVPGYTSTYGDFYAFAFAQTESASNDQEAEVAAGNDDVYDQAATGECSTLRLGGKVGTVNVEAGDTPA